MNPNIEKGVLLKRASSMSSILSGRGQLSGPSGVVDCEAAMPSKGCKTANPNPILRDLPDTRRGILWNGEYDDCFLTCQTAGTGELNRWRPMGFAVGCGVAGLWQELQPGLASAVDWTHLPIGGCDLLDDTCPSAA